MTLMTPQEQLRRVLATKAAQRTASREKSWPEKVLIIERLRDTTSMARKAMSAQVKRK